MKKDKKNAWLGGVCAGLAKKLEIDPFVMRMVFVLGTLVLGVFPIIYLVLFLVMENEQE